MYNRYQGNSGRVERVPDAPQPEIRPRPPAPSGGNNKPPPGLTGGGLQQLLQKFSLADLESEDLLLILVLYLMYRESGDKELLFILGGMLFLYRSGTNCSGGCASGRKWLKMACAMRGQALPSP